MTGTYELTLYVDGGSRGNPGPAAIGAVILRDGVQAETLSCHIGVATNNEAEYSALVEGLRAAGKFKARSIHVKADSQLMVKQLLGQYKVKSEGIKPLFAEAKNLLKAYESVGIEHIGREDNGAADKLVNEALDKAEGKKPRPKKSDDGKGCPKLPGPAPVVSLLTDFGTTDAWVAILKGIIQEGCPGACIIDISHDVPAYDVMKGAFVLETAVAHIKAVAHVAVVDPGVGGEGKALLLRTHRGDCLVGPDNGILIPAARRLGGIAQAFVIHTNDAPSGSTFGCGTFHARDVYAPTAVRLAKGEAPEDIGIICDPSGLAHAPFQTAIVGPGNIDGAVVDVDRFGTLRINARRDDAEKAGFVPGATVKVSFIGGDHSVRMVKTFSDAHQGGEILLYDSSDYLCLGLNGAHAGLAFGLKAGDTILLELTVK